MKKKILATFIIFASILAPQQTNASEVYVSMIDDVCATYEICPELIQGIVFTESNGNPNAVSSAGAVGLCQIIPKWHADRMQRLGVTDLYDPYSNILVCVDYISQLRDMYGDLYAVLNAYNTGKPSYEETAYVKKVLDKAYQMESLNGKHEY